MSTLAAFTPKAGAGEYAITVISDPFLEIKKALEQIEERYGRMLAENGLGQNEAVFARIFLCDIENQKDALLCSSLYRRLGRSAVSVFGQQPLECGPVALFAYHISTCGGKEITREPVVARGDWTGNSLMVTGGGYRMLWNTGYAGDSGLEGSCLQSEKAFSSIADAVESTGMKLSQNTIRTWITVRDIDNNYAGMVKARRELFARKGLGAKTRFIASTGIEGQGLTTGSLVTFDALSIAPLEEGQVSRIEATDFLSSTTIYGVHFERGLRVRFGDRSHLYISGTASIDSTGKIVAAGDIRGQIERTIENVRALLKGQGADLDAMTHLLVYLRDPNDLKVVREVVERKFGNDLPRLYLRGAVCRPGWLVEIEGTAVTIDDTQYPPFFGGPSG
jgi:enamine deaminase RidA (YjgF/YER057c/UK114 family)